MLAKPAIISHLGAMSFHFPDIVGVGHCLTFMTTERISAGRQNDIIFQPIRVDQARMDWADEQEHTREGQPVFVTSIAATLVDCLADLDRSPPIDDLMLAFMVAKKLKVKARAMISHALRYESPLLCSRLGICLTCADFFPEEDERARLQKASLKRIAHFRRTEANPKTDRYFPPWNIIVPSELYAFVRAP
jgi:predicted transcriptional regulator of viral defense system